MMAEEISIPRVSKLARLAAMQLLDFGYSVGLTLEVGGQQETFQLPLSDVEEIVRFTVALVPLEKEDNE